MKKNHLQRLKNLQNRLIAFVKDYIIMSKIGKYFLRKKEQLNLICIYEDEISYCFQLELKQSAK